MVMGTHLYWKHSMYNVIYLTANKTKFTADCALNHVKVTL